jgi:hypothetical protein
MESAPNRVFGIGVLDIGDWILVGLAEIGNIQ